MISAFYCAVLAAYCLILLGALVWYLSRRAPRGDASVGWATGIFYTAGLAGIILVAALLRNSPDIGLVVLAAPALFLALPAIRRALTDAYARWPAFAGTPALTLHVENNSEAQVRLKLECWFGAGNAHTASLYATFGYSVAPLEQAAFALTAHQTRLLAHKARYVSIVLYELVTMQYAGETYVKEVQPCMQFYDEKTEAFRSGTYTVVVDEHKNTEAFKAEVRMLKQNEGYGSGVF